MKTKCYCIFCPNHPFNSKQKEFKDWLTGYESESLISSKFEGQGKEVDCLQPSSEAFDALGMEGKVEDFEWKVTAYGDGSAITSTSGPDYIIYARCKNEKYKEV